jgi:hypothetical protein
MKIMRGVPRTLAPITCEDKACYSAGNKEAAEKDLASLKRSDHYDGLPMNIYWCWLHRAWHIGHDPRREGSESEHVEVRKSSEGISSSVGHASSAELSIGA